MGEVKQSISDNNDRSPIIPRLEPLMHFRADVENELAIQRGREGAAKLSICYFRGGTFEGPRLKGALLSGGGDWAVYKNRDFLDIDVRGVLRTHDAALIYMEYRGLWRAMPGTLPRVLERGGEKFFDPREHYLRVAARFETHDARYEWLNGIIAIGIGSRTAEGVSYDFFELF